MAVAAEKLPPENASVRRQLHTVALFCALAMLSFVLGIRAASAQVGRPGRCLEYEPTVVKLSGTLIRRTFPGPPEYESIAKGDRAETSWLVEIRSPICVDEDKAEPLINTAKRNIRSVQLVLDQKMYKQYRKLIGHKVVATGTLFGEITAHHHTPVLLMVSKLEPAR